MSIPDRFLSSNYQLMLSGLLGGRESCHVKSLKRRWYQRWCAHHCIYNGSFMDANGNAPVVCAEGEAQSKEWRSFWEQKQLLVMKKVLLLCRCMLMVGGASPFHGCGCNGRGILHIHYNWPKSYSLRPAPMFRWGHIDGMQVLSINKKAQF